MEPKAHWERVHAENAADEVSWFQLRPEASLRWIKAAGADPKARIIDVGCGQSGLPGFLLEQGFHHVSGLDVSAEAIQRAQERMGPRAAEVQWIEADVLSFEASEGFDLWHDRAVFHFFTKEADQRRYAQVLERSLAPGGHALLATFAPDGPETCSGLPVARHDPLSLARVLGSAFTLVEGAREEHRTPWNAIQPFTWALFRKSKAGVP